MWSSTILGTKESLPLPKAILASLVPHALAALRDHARRGGANPGARLVTLRRYAPSGSIAAFSVTQDSVITAWNIVLGIAVMLWAFGYTQTKALLKKSGRKQAAAET